MFVPWSQWDLMPLRENPWTVAYSPVSGTHALNVLGHRDADGSYLHI